MNRFDSFVIARVETGDEKTVLYAEDGRKVTLRLSGDCCSSSVFEENSLKEMGELPGKVLRGIEDVAARLSGTAPGAESTSYHALKITTDEGDLVVDWRNDSNGYYDGHCDVEVSYEQNRNG